MSWLNLNSSLNSLKGQITNIASEVFSEGTLHEAADDTSHNNSSVTELEDKCRNLELETASLKKLVDELQASLQSERLSRKNGVKEEESNWYWDPSPQSSKPINNDLEDHYKLQIRALRDEISTLKERDTYDLRPDEELHRLREENIFLSANLEDLDSQHQAAMEKLITLKKDLQQNFELLKQEHADLKYTNEENATEIRRLIDIVEVKDKELESIKSSKSDYETLLHKYKNLESIHGLLRENAEKFQEENQDLHEEVFKLQEHVTKLEHDLELATKHSEPSDMVSRATYEELVKEINVLKDRSNLNQLHCDEINIDDNAKSVIDSLRREINELKHKLSHRDGHESGDKRTIQPEKVMQLYNKYVNFELPIDYVGEIPTAGDNIVLFKLESVFKTVHSFKKELDVLEHKLSEKNLNANHLQTQIDDVTTENDFLTTDIQHLERELNEMKKNNDFLILEIAALKNTSKLEPIIETHEDNLAKLETELADCNKLNKNFESEILRIENELKEVTTEKISLRESLNDLKQKYTTILSEFEVYKNQTKEVEELENRAKEMDLIKYKEAVYEMDDLKKRSNSANAKNEQLSIDIHILENDKVLLINKVDELKTALEDKIVAYNELEKIIFSLQHKVLEFEDKRELVLKHKNDIKSDKSILEKSSTEKREISTANSTVDAITENKMMIEKIDHFLRENLNLLQVVKDMNTETEETRRLATEAEKENKNLQIQILNEKEIKVNQAKAYNDTIAALKSENQKITDTKLETELELTNTNNKIRHLEEDLQKIILDLNEKDTLIDNLNSNEMKNNGTLHNLKETITQLESSLALRNNEIQYLKKTLEEVTIKLNNSSQSTNHSQEELHKLQVEKEEATKSLLSLNDEIQDNHNLISTLTARAELSEKINNELKAVIENKDKEIKELNQSIVELTDKIKASENVTQHENHYETVVREKEEYAVQLTELRNQLIVKDKSLEELNEKQEQFDKTKEELKVLIENATSEKSELINLVNLKHNESIQYHNEIQRLNHVILEQSNEFKRIVEEKDSLLQKTTNICTQCEQLMVRLKEKEGAISLLNERVDGYEKANADLSQARESVTHLKERCENLDKSLAIQLDIVKALTSKNVQLSEEGKNMEYELERLRHHLVDTEENYTQELMVSEQKLTECQTRLHTIEERAKQTSTVYTSNSIRANQEVETLRTQIKLLEKQRDEVQVRLSEAEDERSRSEAALTNLQVVLEQFQLDKERDISTATEKIRNKMEELNRRNIAHISEIERLNTKLEEALQGLQAATRLGDQVETKTAQINDLKEQVRTLQTSVTAAEERYYNAISNQQDKVDKNLVKNLVINYVLNAAGNHTNKIQVLRVLSTVLDFNQQECERLGLVRSTNTTDSLAAEFVKFLQNESRPRAVLPNMMTLGQNSSRSTTPSSRKNSTIGPHPNIQALNPGHSRNPSTGSNNLLFTNLDTMETSSQRSRDSDRTEPKVISPSLDTGINQTRNTEGAILKSVLKDM